MWGFICFVILMIVLYKTRDKKEMTLDEIVAEEERRDAPGRKARDEQRELLGMVRTLYNKSYKD